MAQPVQLQQAALGARALPAQRKACRVCHIHRSVAAHAMPEFDIAASLGLQPALTPVAEYFASLNLPQAIVKWGHPGNMAVVLLAMGGYGSGVLGWQIRLSKDSVTLKKAKSLHPKLAIGMGVLFALGGIGGMISLIMQGQNIFNSSHVWTGLTGLLLLSLQAMLPLFFKESPGTRTTHAFLGSGILALFAVHALIGLKLGLSLA